MTGETQQYNMFEGVLEKVIASTLASLLIAVVGFGIYINSSISTLSSQIGYSNLNVQNLTGKVTRLQDRMGTFEAEFMRRMEILELFKRVEDAMDKDRMQMLLEFDGILNRINIKISDYNRVIMSEEKE